MATSINHTRSISFPPKSYPILQKIEQELVKLRKAEASSKSLIETICIGLKGLARLYKCVDDVLSLPLSQQSLSLSFGNNQTHVKSLVEGTFKLLEISGTSKQIMFRLLESIRAFGVLNKETEISSYFSLRKEIAKTAKSLVLELRQLEGNLVSKNEFDEEFEVIRVLKCVSIINISVLESLLKFLGMPLMSSKMTSRSFALFSKLMVKKQRKSGIVEEKLKKTGNELSDADVVLQAFDEEKVDFSVVKKRLDVLEGSLSGIDYELNNICKQLTKTKASFMNIISV
ncbi:unnamed protein product [Amaranthus hypochondriacus]